MPISNAHLRGNDKVFPSEHQSGLTIREHFAAMALQGLLAQGPLDYEGGTQAALHYADALLAQLHPGDLGGPVKKE